MWMFSSNYSVSNISSVLGTVQSIAKMMRKRVTTLNESLGSFSFLFNVTEMCLLFHSMEIDPKQYIQRERCTNSMDMNTIGQIFMEYLMRLSYCEITIDSDWPISLFSLSAFPISKESKSIRTETTPMPFHTALCWRKITSVWAKIFASNWHRSNIWCSSKYVLEFLTTVDFFSDASAWEMVKNVRKSKEKPSSK